MAFVQVISLRPVTQRFQNASTAESTGRANPRICSQPGARANAHKLWQSASICQPVSGETRTTMPASLF